MAQTYSMDSKYNAKKIVKDVLEKTKSEYNKGRKKVIERLIDYYNGDNDILESGLEVICSKIVILEVIIDSGFPNFLLLYDSNNI